jgi:hypothetical protein
VEHFDLPSPGLVFGVFLLVTLVPIAIFTFIPAVLFRVHFRRNRRLWGGRIEHVVRAAYRGATVVVETPSRVPLTVAAVSLASLYLAAPVFIVGPMSVAAMLGGFGKEALIGVTCSLLMLASGVVGCSILRPSREAARGACVVAGAELLFALAAAWHEWAPLAIIAAVHAVLLLTAAFVNQRGNVRMCA